MSASTSTNRAATRRFASAARRALGAQDLAQARDRVGRDGATSIYPSRPNVCGDGRSFIQNVLGDNQVLLRHRIVRRRATTAHRRSAFTVRRASLATVIGWRGDAAAPLRRTGSEHAGRYADDQRVGRRGRRNGSATWCHARDVARRVGGDASARWSPTRRIRGRCCCEVARDDNRPRDVRAVDAALAVQRRHRSSRHCRRRLARDRRRRDARRKRCSCCRSGRKSESVPELIDLAKNGEASGGAQSRDLLARPVRRPARRRRLRRAARARARREQKQERVV